MKNDKDKVDRILNSLEGVEQASPGPYFFTRLQQRLLMGKNSTWYKVGSWISKPAIAFGSLLIVIVLNLAVLFHKPNKAERFEDNDDYGITASAIFDNENPETE